MRRVNADRRKRRTGAGAKRRRRVALLQCRRRRLEYSPLDAIDRSNVARLGVAWRHAALDPELRQSVRGLTASNYYRVTPLMVGGRVYVQNAVGLVEALDPASGQATWTQKPLEPGLAGLSGATVARSIVYWRAAADERLFTVRKNLLFALDARTGDPVRTFGQNGQVNLQLGIGADAAYNWGGAPLVVNDVVVIGLQPRRLSKQEDAVSRGTCAATTRAPASCCGRSTSCRGRASSATTPGATTRGSTPATSARGRCIDGGRGARLRLHPADRADQRLLRRPPARRQPVLRRAGRARREDRQARLALPDRPPRPLGLRPAGAADRSATSPSTAGASRRSCSRTRTASSYVFDRTTGKPVWPIEERPVPQSTVPGEKTSPTQPFPTKPPAFDRQGVTDDDLIDFTPELRARGARDREAVRDRADVHAAAAAATRPAGSKGRCSCPGRGARRNWNGGAFDPETGMLYVPSVTRRSPGAVEPRDPKVTELRYVNPLGIRERDRRRPATGCRSSSRRTAASSRSI